MAVPKLPDGVAPKWNSPASFDERNIENRYEQTYYCIQADSSGSFTLLLSNLRPGVQKLRSRGWSARWVQPWLILAMCGSLSSLRGCEKYCIAYKHQ